MTLETALDQPALFTIATAPAALDELSVRERRLLVGALNFHALMAPGQTLTIHGYDGDWTTLPRTTDDSTFTGMSRVFRKRIFSFDIESRVRPEERPAIVAEKPSLRLSSRETRHLHVSRDAVLDFDPPRDISPDPVRRVLRAIRAKAPLWYDEARDVELLRHRRALLTSAPRRRYEEEFHPGGGHSHADSEIIPAYTFHADAPRAVIVGLHWFELGGAERWAFETVRLAREAGLIPIVLTNRDSHQPWIGRPELDGALLIPFSEATALSQTPGVEELLRALMREFDVRGVVVHHNQWLYDRLHWIRKSRPNIPIVDSTHIVEYRGGGYPLSSAMVEEVITAHHVISPSLARWMTDVQRIDPKKIVMAPLGGLTVDVSTPVFRDRAPDESFVVAFVGRISRQKAPEVFVSMARRMRGLPNVEFIMHGDGELSSWLDDVIRSQGMEGRIRRRNSSVAVSMTLDEAHVLVVPSHNEGLTLTSLEAIAHGVPVVSTAVGGQGDLIPNRALVPRRAHAAARELTRVVSGLVGDEISRKKLWIDELSAERGLLAQRSASEWFQEEISGW
ncbi:glycosyltransferase [Microbacterium sp. cx-55]|uniref:glycosyltransferase n=1 Tax=Microbacterium sp. cx-55 TaxID=2875948 RepID=UPI001CBD666A|nr:glycosyltransferase [Microbacterium sp. cx-55]MBZ4487083.1 glycosyltransferase [Microbacterium sp. cx-55]UGB35997.1 glycosyltransferase [Microbacterium sp. cx-55]